MSDYSSGSSSGSSSESEVPPAPSAYVPRGVKSIADSLMWDPNILPADALNSFLLDARRVDPTLSVAALLDLVREADYDLPAAQRTIIQPIVAPDIAPAAAAVARTYSGSDSADVLRRLAAHRSLHQTAAIMAQTQTDDSTENELDTIAKQVSTRNGHIDEQRWIATAAAATQAINSVTSALATSNKPKDNAQPNGATPVAKKPTKKNDVPSGGAVGVGAGDAMVDVVSVSDSGSPPTPLDASFLYPWMIQPGFPTRTPLEPLIDVQKLRDIVQIVTDAVDSSTKPPPGEGTSWSTLRNALLAIPKNQLRTIQELLATKNDWLDRARPLLNQISRNKDNQTLDGILELLKDLEWSAPGIDSRERRRLITIVNKIQEWRVRCQMTFKQAAIGKPLEEGLLVHESVVRRIMNNGASPQSAGRTASPCNSKEETTNNTTDTNNNDDNSNPTAVTPLSPVAAPPYVPLTLPILSRMLKECDKACGCIASDESTFLRTVYDYTLNFVRQVCTLLECRVERVVADDDVKVEDVSMTESPQEDAASSDPNNAAADRRPPRVAVAQLQRVDAPTPSPTDDPNAVPPNEYPRASTLPSKLSLTHADSLLARFETRFQFHFKVPQATLLYREIQRCNQWIVDAREMLQRARRPSDSIAEWIDTLNYQIGLIDTLPITIDRPDVESLLKGLKSRLWSASVDLAFEVAPLDPTAAACESNQIDPTRPVTPSTRRGPTLQQVYNLLEEAVTIPIPSTVERYGRLESLIAQSQSFIGIASGLLGPKSAKVTLAEWQALLTNIRRMPVHIDEEARIERVINNTLEWHKKASALLPSPVCDGIPPPAHPLPTPHSIPFHELESLLHKTTHGKSLALITDQCPDPAHNSSTFTSLNLYLKVGRSWAGEVQECFRQLASAGSKKGAQATTNGHNANAMTKVEVVARLKQLLGIYTWRDSEIHDDAEEEGKTEEKEDDVKQGDCVDANVSMVDVDPTVSSAPSPSSDPSVPSAVSLPSSDPSSWSWLSKYGLPLLTFEALLPHLDLKLADTLSDRLSLVSECLAMAWAAVKGPNKSGVMTLKKLVHQLQQSGELETAEPLRTLHARLKLAVKWRAQVRKALPQGYLAELKRKQRRRMGRDSTALMLPSSMQVRGSRRARKKSGTHFSSTGAGDAADDESEHELDSQGATIDLYQFSDDDDDDAHGDERQHDTGDADTRKSYTTTLGDLQQLDAVYQRFVGHRQQHGDAPLPATRPSTPSTHGPTNPTSMDVIIQGAWDDSPDLDSLSLGLDLVDLDECEILRSCIDECIGWQDKAKQTLAEPACVLLASRLNNLKPIFHEPILPPTTKDATNTLQLHAPHMPIVCPNSPADLEAAPGDEACIEMVRDVISEFDELDVFIPEMDQLAHLAWAREWIQQAQSLLMRCREIGVDQLIVSTELNAAPPSPPPASDPTPLPLESAMKDEPMDPTADIPNDTIDQPIATHAPVAISELATDAPTSVAADTAVCVSASAVAPSSSSVSSHVVSLDDLVSLLRGLRAQFGPSEYTPLVFHLQSLRASTKGRSVHEHKEESEGEEEEPEEEHEEEHNAEEEEKKSEDKHNDSVKEETNTVPPTAAPTHVADDASAVETIVKVELAVEPTPLPAVIDGDAAAAAADATMKMETDIDEPKHDVADVDVDADGDGDGGVDVILSDASNLPPSELHPFLRTFQYDIQHIEFYVYELLHYSHRLRQLFERRLGSVHATLLLGPPREELMVWLADAADEAGLAGAIAATTNNEAAHNNSGSGLLATCRRLRHTRTRDRTRAPVASTVAASKSQSHNNAVVSSKGRDRRRSGHSPPPSDVNTSIDPPVSVKKEKEQRKRVKKERFGDEEEPSPAKRGRKKNQAGAAPETAAAAASSSPTAAAAVSSAALPVDTPVDASFSVDVDDGVDDDHTLHCLCQRPYVEGEVMISCDVCEQWFHTTCLNLSKSDVKKVDELKFMCPQCAKAAKKVFRFRDKLPNRKGKSRGPKLASLMALLAKVPNFLSCEEVDKAREITHRAIEWTRMAEAELNKPPTEAIQQQQQQQQQQPPLNVSLQQPHSVDQSIVTSANPAADVSMVDVSNVDPPLVDPSDHTATHSALPPPPPSSCVAPPLAPVDSVHATRRGSPPVDAASSSSVIGAPTRKDVENILKLECQQREGWLKIRVAYTDHLSDHLRLGMGLPLELTGRKVLEDRIRLLLNLEKAERILLDNVTVPLLPTGGDDEAEAEALAAAAEANNEEKATDRPGGEKHTAAKEKEQTPITPHAKRHEAKEIGLIHQELLKCGADKYQEPLAAQNPVWSRFDSFYNRLQSWIDTTNHTLYKAPTSTLHSLLVLRTDYKNHFLMVVCSTFGDLSKRLAHVLKWIPREKKAIAKKMRSAQLWKLQLERVTDCGITTSPYTLKIQAECSRIEDWDKRLHLAMENKQGPSHFKSLLKEVLDGAHPILVDLKDIKLCEGFTELYCLCQAHYQDGVFMIQCDGCEDWFHETCVNLTIKIAEKIKHFKCPRCCQKEGVAYKYGHVVLPSVQAPTQSTQTQQAPNGTTSVQAPTHTSVQAPTSQPTSQAPHATAAAIPATTVSQAIVPSFSSPGWSSMEMNGGMWPGPGGMPHQMITMQQQQQQSQAQSSQAAVHQPQPPPGVEKGKNKRKKSGAPSESKKKRSAAGAHDSDSDTPRKPKKPKHQPAPPAMLSANDASVAALQEATLAATAAGVVGPMSLAVLQHEPLLSVPTDAPPPRTAALYATLLYENLHVQVTTENSNVLWHLLNGYMNRMFDSRLEEEILEAAKLVCGEQLLTDALQHVNPLYTAQVQLQWRQQQHQHAQMVAMQKAAHAPQHAQPAIAQQRASAASAAAINAAVAAAAFDSESSGEDDEEKPPSKSKAKRKPKNYPRPPLSAYKCFVRHLKSTPSTSPSAVGATQTMLQSLQSVADAHGKTLNKLLSEKWRQLPKEQKVIFEQECVGEKEKYDAAVEAWHQAQAEHQPPSAAPPARTPAATGGAVAGVAAEQADDNVDMVDVDSSPVAAAAAATPIKSPHETSLQSPVHATAATPVHSYAMHPSHSHSHPHLAGIALKAGVPQALPSQAIVHASQPATTLLHHHPQHIMPHSMYPHHFSANPALHHYLAMQQQSERAQAYMIQQQHVAHAHPVHVQQASVAQPVVDGEHLASPAGTAPTGSASAAALVVPSLPVATEIDRSTVTAAAEAAAAAAANETTLQ